jgi:hypothetical protein
LGHALIALLDEAERKNDKQNTIIKISFEKGGAWGTIFIN